MAAQRAVLGIRFFQVAPVTETRSRAASLAGDLQPLIPAASRRAYPFVAFADLAIELLVSPGDWESGDPDGGRVKKVGQP